MSQSLPWPALLAGAVFFSASAMLLYESVRGYFPRANLAAFDSERAAALSDELRAVYERELFSELSQWNRPSHRYPTKASGRQRDKRWKQLAEQGLELAHIALQVLQPDGGFVYPLDEPMNRLLTLAEHGDAGAMCLMSGLATQVKRSRLSAKHSAMAGKWLLRGAELGHAECQLQLGRRLLLGTGGMTKDAERGLSLELAARRTGYAHDVDGLVSHFQKRWSTEIGDLTRLYCWLSIDAESRRTDGPQHMLRLLRADARRISSERLMAVANELENSRFSLQACVDLSSG